MKIKNILISIILIYLLNACSNKRMAENNNKIIYNDEFDKQFKLYSIYYCSNENNYQVSIDTMKIDTFKTLNEAKNDITNKIKRNFQINKQMDDDLNEWVNSQPKVCGKKIQ